MITVSANFRKSAQKAVGAIGLFIFVYVILILLGATLAAFCCYYGISLIIALPGLITLALGAGLAGMGLLVLIFLIKFVFSTNTPDSAQRVELSEAEEPGLFKFVSEVADQVQTARPHKMFLSADVNASVFYNSSFRSMFLPERKNLSIGLGLVNTITVEEFRGVLAHEFGHFSQRSMRVGSYVYNVNRVIFNMLFENDSYGTLVQKWNALGGFVAMFAYLAMKIVQGIQWVLRQLYTLVNKNYMALSREMELHADQVAATVAGSEPLAASLLRMGLAESAYGSVLDFYDQRISEALITANIYVQHRHAMTYMAARYQVPIEHGLPAVSLQFLGRFNKSKLNVKDQWASHPGVEDRVEQLRLLNIAVAQPDSRSANTLFVNLEKWQTTLTNNIFASVTYTTPTAALTGDEFEALYQQNFVENTFSRRFNYYYDYRNPVVPEADTSVVVTPEALSFESLYCNEMVDTVLANASLEQDIITLKQIESREFKIKTFDYDGAKYHWRDSGLLISDLEKQQTALNEKIKTNDENIYKYFNRLAEQTGLGLLLNEKWIQFTSADKAYGDNLAAYQGIIAEVDFISQTTPVETIRTKLSELKITEKIFKEKIAVLLETGGAEKLLVDKAIFEKYLSEEWVYFEKDKYKDEVLEILFAAIRTYPALLSNNYFIAKKSLLNCFEALEEQKVQADPPAVIREV